MWYLSDSVLDVSLKESSPVPLAMPLIMPTMWWFQNNEIEKVEMLPLAPDMCICRKDMQTPPTTGSQSRAATA